MSVRSIKRKETQSDNPWAYTLFDFPKGKDGVLYVRQSSGAQVEHNIHSYEMQTDKLLEHFRNMGCTGNIIIIDIDEGMSGTLDMHQRPGMLRLMKLIQQEKIGWVGVVHVNRLFRDQWMIGPDTFIKECYQHNVVVATPRSVFNFRDQNSYSIRIFRIEAEEAARHLEWMKLVLGGAKRVASSNGLYDGRFLVPGFIVDRSDEKHKKVVIYRPQIPGVQWLFRRFFELDAEVERLGDEVEALPYLFPKFESWVDKKSVTRRRSKKTEEGHYKPTMNGIKSILTNPIYIGWWIPLDGGVIEDHHEAIVDPGIFWYAFNRLSSYDIEGERVKPQQITRYGPCEALLKKVIQSEKGTLANVKRGGAKEYYTIKAYNGYRRKYELEIAVSLADTIFLDKFLERFATLEGYEDWEDIIEQRESELAERNEMIKKQIKDVVAKMARLDELLTDIENPLPTSLKGKYIQDYEGLEKKKKKLEADLQEPDDEDEDEEGILFQIQPLLPRIVQEWPNLPFKKRMRLVNALVGRIVLRRGSPMWLEMHIEWKDIVDWGVDVAHIRRNTTKVTGWTEEEERILREMYPNKDANEILAALPNHSWQAIRIRASKLGVKRNPQAIKVIEGGEFLLSLNDREYMEECGLSKETTLHWSHRAG